MTFNWMKVGDQDRCLRKVCCLGPIMLEIVESSWGKDICFAECIVHRWNDITKDYSIETVSHDEIDYKDAHTYMEDWYGLNIRSEELLLGVENESVANR